MLKTDYIEKGIVDLINKQVISQSTQCVIEYDDLGNQYPKIIGALNRFTVISIDTDMYYLDGEAGTIMIPIVQFNKLFITNEKY